MACSKTEAVDTIMCLKKLLGHCLVDRGNRYYKVFEEAWLADRGRSRYYKVAPSRIPRVAEQTLLGG